MALADVHVWLGRFDSLERWLAYLEEHDDAETGERPLNQFAADQGETWYDHDGIDYNFDGGVPSATSASAETLFGALSYAPSFMDAALADASLEPLDGANAVIGIEAGEISTPRSVTGDGFELRFVGTYRRLPRAAAFDPTATKLDLNHQRLTEIPSGLFDLIHLSELSLSDNLLTSIPERIDQLQNLETIYLWDNQLVDLPDALFQLPKLRKVKADNNALRSLPTTIGEAVNLRSLTVSRSSIARIPDQIGDLSQLELLDISSNELTELPPTVGRLRSLTHLRIDGNEISRLPDEITALPTLAQLSLPRAFDESAQSPAVREWLAVQRR